MGWRVCTHSSTSVTLHRSTIKLLDFHNLFYGISFKCRSTIKIVSYCLIRFHLHGLNRPHFHGQMYNRYVQTYILILLVFKTGFPVATIFTAPFSNLRLSIITFLPSQALCPNPCPRHICHWSLPQGCFFHLYHITYSKVKNLLLILPININ